MRTTGGRLALWILLGLFCSGSAAADLVPFRVLIHELTQLDGSFDAAGPLGDFYAKVTVAGETMDNESENCDDTPDPLQGMAVPFTLFRNFRATKQDGVAFCPGTVPWIFDFVVDDSAAVDVRIQIFDSDNFLSGRDDEADLLDGGDRSVDLVIDPTTGQWSGDFTFPTNCSRALNELDDNHVRICFQASFDRDGDGLLDAWETAGGIDMDGDGEIDAPLPNANPFHKDLYYEIDWMPGAEPFQFAIEDVKEAFALAPLGAGGLDNPDGVEGINLWIDTGSLVDPGASESGMGSCADSVDNDGDGETDGDDPDCLAGDDIGGGNPLPAVDLFALNSRFYDLKSSNFDEGRVFAYRYGIVATRPADRPGTTTGSNGVRTLRDDSANWLPQELAGREITVTTAMAGAQTRKARNNTENQLTVDEPWDEVPEAGDAYLIDGSVSCGRAERGGNDLALWVRNAPAMMHEMGHNLNLSHGGSEVEEDEDVRNCKPNYVSIMNYDHAFGTGIERTIGGGVIDFSPVRISTGRALAPLPDLDEADLDERIPLEPGNNEVFFVWRDPSGMAIRNNVLGDMVNWNDEDPKDESSVAVNIDLASISECAIKNTALEVLEGHDDWTNISLSFIEFGSSANLALGGLPVEPTIAEAQAAERALNTLDLAVSKSAAPEVPEAGGEYTYTLHAENRGPNAALAVAVVDVLPAGVTLVEAPDECVESPVGVVRCELGVLRAEVEQELSLVVEASDVCVGGVPQAIVNQVSVSNEVELPGPDLEPADNDFALATTPVDTRPPVVMASIREITDGGGDPDEARSEMLFVCQDVCDDAPEVVARANGVLVELGQLVVFEEQSESQAEFEDGILYLEGPAFELVATCTDGSGNVAVATATPGAPGLSIELETTSNESGETQGCGLGFEVAFALGIVPVLRRRIRQGRQRRAAGIRS